MLVSPGSVFAFKKIYISVFPFFPNLEFYFPDHPDLLIQKSGYDLLKYYRPALLENSKLFFSL